MAPLAVTLALALSVPPAEAQKASNMKPIASHYSASRGELTLVLTSISAATDPIDPVKREFVAEVVTADNKSFWEPYLNLRVVVLGDLVREEYRNRRRLFRFSLVLDESTSITEVQLRSVRSDILYFLKELPVTYEAQVIRFSDTVAPPSPFTNDPQALAAALQAPRLKGQTALYDAVELALLKLIERRDDVPLSFCVVFTDGKNTSGQITDDEAFKQRVRSLTSENAIPLFLVGVEGANDAVLGDVARNSLGLYVKIGAVDQLKEALDVFRQQINKTYVISIPVPPGTRVRAVNLHHEMTPARRKFIQDVPIREGLVD